MTVQVFAYPDEAQTYIAAFHDARANRQGQVFTSDELIGYLLTGGTIDPDMWRVRSTFHMEQLVYYRVKYGFKDVPLAVELINEAQLAWKSKEFRLFNEREFAGHFLEVGKKQVDDRLNSVHKEAANVLMRQVWQAEN